MEETSNSTCQSREKVVEEAGVVASVEVAAVVASVEVAVVASVEVAVVASEEVGVVASEEAVVDLVEIAAAGVVVSEVEIAAAEAVIAVVVSSVLPSVQIEDKSSLVKVRKFFLTEWYLVDESRELVAKAPNVPVWFAIKHQKVFCGSCPM